MAVRRKGGKSQWARSSRVRSSSVSRARLSPFPPLRTPVTQANKQKKTQNALLVYVPLPWRSVWSISLPITWAPKWEQDTSTLPDKKRKKKCFQKKYCYKKQNSNREKQAKKLTCSNKRIKYKTSWMYLKNQNFKKSVLKKYNTLGDSPVKEPAIDFRWNLVCCRYSTRRC